MIQVITGERVSDGDGVSINRIIGTKVLDYADPFLMLDEFRSEDKEDYRGGFPMHPHRGFETITYMVEGSFTHRDSNGNEGSLKSGEVQWMTAGKGIIHEEMPAMEEGQLWGYQLWINLPAKMKMIEPKYRHLSIEEMPIVDQPGVKVKIISGKYADKEGPIELFIPVDYFDVRLDGGTFEKSLKGTNLVYVHLGKVIITADKEVEVRAGSLCLIEDFDKIHVKGDKAGFLFLSADPLRERMAKYGPFVMNDMDEVLQAIDDFNNGNLDK